jgi:sulfate permease, SulP family
LNLQAPRKGTETIMQIDSSNAPTRRFGKRLSLAGDLRGGLTAAALTLVTAASYATAAAAPLGASMSAAAVLSGLVGAVLGGTIAAVLGPVPTQMFAPRASVAVVVASAITTFSQQVEPGPTAVVHVLFWLSNCLLLASLLQWCFGALRLGTLIRLVPHSVTAGLTIGLALAMVWSQLPHVWPGGEGSSLALVLALATTGGICWARWRGWDGWAIPFGLLTGVAIYQLLHLGPVGLQLPKLQVVELSAAPLLWLPGLTEAIKLDTAARVLPSLVPLALIVAFVNSIETLTSAMAIEELTHRRFDADRALTAGAIGSLAAVCAGGLPVAGSSVISVANLKAGGRTRVSVLIAGAALLALAWACRLWLDAVPLCVVAGIMFSVALALAHAPCLELCTPRTPSPRPIGGWAGDIFVAALVGVLLLCVGIVTAMVFGIVAAAVLTVTQFRRNLVWRHYDGNDPRAALRVDFNIEPELGRRIYIVEVRQPLFFATAEKVFDLIEHLDEPVRFVILDLTRAGVVDSTAIRMLIRCGTALRALDQNLLVVAGCHGDALQNMGSSCRVYSRLAQALADVCVDHPPQSAADVADVPPVADRAPMRNERRERFRLDAEHRQSDPTTAFRAEGVRLLCKAVFGTGPGQPDRVVDDAKALEK